MGEHGGGEKGKKGETSPSSPMQTCGVVPVARYCLHGTTLA